MIDSDLPVNGDARPEGQHALVQVEEEVAGGSPSAMLALPDDVWLVTVACRK